jgi:hypothetical protein
MMRKKENKKHDARVLLIQFRAAINNPIVVLAERATTTTTTTGGGGGRPPRGSGASSLLGRRSHLFFFFFFFFSLSDKTFFCRKNSQKLLNPKLNHKECNPKLRRMVFSLFPQHERRKNFCSRFAALYAHTHASRENER